MRVESSRERLAGFHRVENTYLSTFQSLGALGLVLGTIGLLAVLLRNVLERRAELALLRAMGYRERTLAAMVVAEHVLLLGRRPRVRNRLGAGGDCAGPGRPRRSRACRR